MPPYTNQFRRPHHYNHNIENKDTREMIGTLRVKPVGLLWRPKDDTRFYSVSLDQFIEWITSKETKARRTKS